MDEVFNLIIWCVVVISVILGILTIIRFRAFSGAFKFYGLWIINGAIMEVISKIMADEGVENLFLFHVNAILEYSLLVLFFDSLLKSSGYRGIYFMLFPGILAILINTLFIQKIDMFNSYSLTMISLATVLICIYYFILLSDMVLSLDKKIFQAIVVGSIFVIHSSSLVPLLFGNFLVTMEHNTQVIVWILRACIILVVKIIMIYALLPHIFSVDIKD